MCESILITLEKGKRWNMTYKIFIEMKKPPMFKKRYNCRKQIKHIKYNLLIKTCRKLVLME